jgi:flagellar hook-basal body complex protein FliE
MALPAAAAAAYQSIQQMGQAAASPAAAPAGAGNFSDFLSGAIKDSINSIKQGEQATTAQAMNKSNVVDVVHSMNAAELTLDTVVAVRDKVVAAYQSIMTMPI